ncbi:hypothetical protein ACIOC2_21660 [Streptomyces sp. NPDC088337]|uniref:hypothetical protein n=1 Tax=unclassified Streptomyces TaxID=2593676 RepID=UPI000C2725B3|nr:MULTISPECIES: hypothetical protein [unclassified Streptomyces]PJM92681.1 hypothetical protein CG719_27305 [Streptomyces sp. CB01373]WSB30473.1 hypothetical protein OIE49_33995 [Streptomyces sp. NBC_01788]
MIAHTSEKHPVRPPETGWAQARRRQEEGVRTCLPALEDRRGGPQQDRTGNESNIVRGED